ncbi:hypothetical protein G3N58_23530 [Paraburkholderia sp. Ac-20342]|uniref:hypothetical protein n=1 Tax=Paraburkholderia sp. Ac-20342 TaxID=2703889 RepID=UPI00198097B1|nr:hypothetical protein [Paraburkholderia sp. Ac-20342]MBN3849771.1 hypothetical protein [Paraburkholderia sp. Ac-20342]
MDTKEEITRRLTALVGLNVSWVSHAADMLTMQFGPQRQYTTSRGTVLEGGAFALHVQCSWRLEEGGRVVATEDDLRGPDEKAHASADCLRGSLVDHGPVIVEAVSVDEAASIVLFLSRDFRLIVTPDGGEDDEDWRFFAPGVSGPHLVIEGCRIAPESFT